MDARHRHLRVTNAPLAPPASGERLAIGPGGLPADAVKRLLGKSFDFVAIDARDGLDAEVLGQAHGFVRGGGTLALSLAPHLEGRFAARVGRFAALGLGGPTPTASTGDALAEQAAVVEALVATLSGPPGGRVVLLSDRGRGKSSALGLALARLPVEVKAVVTAAQADSIAEVEHFAPGRVRYCPPAEIALGHEHFDVILVDEAAQIPVPMLQRMVRRHPHARMAFATTARGYEGTGRGFVLRFLEWLAAEGPVARHTLTRPIRWGEGDPLERWVFDLLLLDAEPARLTGPVVADAVEAVHLDRDALAADESQLREFFGLLVHAHYRTTPGDLHHLLDAPNVHLHALRHEGRVVAASLVALEGGLAPEVEDEVAAGQRRLRGHALPETLVVHAGERGAGQLTMLRSVRIAVHPAVRGLGLGQRLVQHVHEVWNERGFADSGAGRPLDLFGTLFGATPELLQFRRAAGYHLVRVGASRGSRTGEPAAVMVRPCSAAAQALVARLRAVLARDLAHQLTWMGRPGLDPALVAALAVDLPAPAPLDEAECAAVARAYAFGPRTLESVLVPLHRWLQGTAWTGLSQDEERLLRGVVALAGWEATAGPLSLPAAMRAVRRAVRKLLAG